MFLIKVKYLKGGEPSGRPYTFSSDVEVNIGDIVELPHVPTSDADREAVKGLVVEIDVPESEVEALRDKLKTIIRKVETAEPEPINQEENGGAIAGGGDNCI